MPVQRIQPYELGEMTMLRSEGGSVVTVKMPNGVEMKILAEEGEAQLHLGMVGSWSYEWDNGASGTFDVADVEPSAPLPSAGLRSRSA